MYLHLHLDIFFALLSCIAHPPLSRFPFSSLSFQYPCVVTYPLGIFFSRVLFVCFVFIDGSLWFCL